jgi:hypothetical protein
MAETPGADRYSNQEGTWRQHATILYPSRHDRSRRARNAWVHGVRRPARDRQTAARRDRGCRRGQRPVGSLVGQLAQLAGARAVGIAGGPQKCAFVKDELRFDAVVDHRAADFPARLAAVCPRGIDVYFENVGGAIWEAVLPLPNEFARVPVSGLIAQYNGVLSGDGTDRLPAAMRQVLSRRLTILGFFDYDFAAEHYADFLRGRRGRRRGSHSLP